MKHPLIKLFFIIVVAFTVNVVQVETASALAVMLDGGGGGGGTGGGGFLGTPTTYNINLDKAETDPYSPGGTITITSTLHVQTCSNSSGNVTVTATVHNSGITPKVVFSLVGAQGGVDSTGTATLTAPSVGGSYLVDFDISGVVTGGALAGNTYHSVYTLPFTVAASGTNGACSSPAVHYTCASSPASTNNVDGTTTWAWTCPGTGTGTSVSCSEVKPVENVITGVCDNTGAFNCSPGTPSSMWGAGDGSNGGWKWYCDGTPNDVAHQSPLCHYCIAGFGYSWDESSSSCIKIPTPSYTLSVLKLGTGSGTVTSSPTGIDCGATCSASYGSGTPVTLTAGAASGSFFDSWNGAGSGCGTATTCTVTMDTARAVTATFYVNLAVTLSPFNPSTITVGQTSTISFSIQNSVYYDNGICSESGTAPVNWDVSTPHLSGIDNASTQQMNTAGTYTKSVTCTNSGRSATSQTQTLTVVNPTAYTLSVLKSGTGSGTVTSSPSGIDCGATCSASYGSGTPVTLTAGATSGTFTGWTTSPVAGLCPGTGTCTVTMDTAKAVTATFVAATPVPIATLVASPSSITAGNPSTLTATGNNGATGCWLSGGGLSEWISPSNGTKSVSPSSTTTYSVYCWNGFGNSLTAEATVNVVARPTAWIDQSSTTTASGQSFNITWGSTGATSCQLTHNEPLNATITVPWESPVGATSGSQPTSPTMEGIHSWSIVCLNSIGAPSFPVLEGPGIIGTMLNHTVTATPSMSGTLSVTPSPCIINVYESTCNVNLSWTVTNPEGKSSITSSNPSGLNYNGNADPASFNTTMPIVGEHNPTTFYLYNNSKLLTPTGVNVIVKCVANTSWSGIVCVPVTYYTLSVLKSGSGTVISNPAGINCGATCSASYSSGTPVVLTATSGVGYTFTGWIVSDGTSCPGTGTCTVTTNAIKSVFATFTLISGVAPTLTFLASPATVAFGDSSTLQWVTTNAVSCTASGDWSGSKSVPNGSESQSNITVNKSYTLTCVNSVGTSVTKTVPVTIGCATDCSAAKASTICSGQSFSNGCSGICANKGTRVCGSSWKEVAP